MPAPPGAHLSDDGHYWWDASSQQWHPVDVDQSGTGEAGDATAPPPQLTEAEYPHLARIANLGAEAYFAHLCAIADGHAYSGSGDEQVSSDRPDAQRREYAEASCREAVAALQNAFAHPGEDLMRAAYDHGGVFYRDLSSWGDALCNHGQEGPGNDLRAEAYPMTEELGRIHHVLGD
jgi:hypothetical protein